MKELNEKKERLSGIDLLRMLSMLQIVILHTLGHGGVLDSVTPGSIKYSCAWLLEICCYSAVNIFALISGYVGVNSHNSFIDYKRYIKLYLQVLFYSVLGAAICIITKPDSTSLVDLIRSFFPLTNDLYWYFTAYSAAFLFFPVINKLVKDNNERYLIIAVVIASVLFSVFELHTGNLKISNGYSFVWLIYLYFVGAVVNKINLFDYIDLKISFLVIVISTSIIWLQKLHGITFSVDWIDISFNKDIFVSYLSVPVVVVSICYLSIFSKIKINNTIIKKIINLCGKSCFAVYLLNDNRLIREKFIIGHFAKLQQKSVVGMLLHVFLFAISFLMIALLFDIIIYRGCVYVLFHKKRKHN